MLELDSDLATKSANFKSSRKSAILLKVKINRFSVACRQDIKLPFQFFYILFFNGETTRVLYESFNIENILNLKTKLEVKRPILPC